MTREERVELAELIVRYAALHAAEAVALHAQRPDMDEWTRSGDAAQEAYRELWKCLFSIEINEPEQAPKRVVKVRSDGKRLSH